MTFQKSLLDQVDDMAPKCDEQSWADLQIDFSVLASTFDDVGDQVKYPLNFKIAWHQGWVTHGYPRLVARIFWAIPSCQWN